MTHSVIFNNSNSDCILVGEDAVRRTFMRFDSVSALVRHLAKQLIDIPRNRVFTGYGEWKKANK